MSISAQCSACLASRHPSMWSSDVPWESWLVFLDRHASISQAKGTVKLPRKRAPLSKLPQHRQSVLCLHFLLMLQCYSWRWRRPRSWFLLGFFKPTVCVSSTRLTLAPQPCARRYMHVNFSLKEKSVSIFFSFLFFFFFWEAVWQV